MRPVVLWAARRFATPRASPDRAPLPPARWLPSPSIARTPARRTPRAPLLERRPCSAYDYPQTQRWVSYPRHGSKVVLLEMLFGHFADSCARIAPFQKLDIGLDLGVQRHAAPFRAGLAREQANARVEYKLQQQSGPRGVVHQRIVQLRRAASDLGKVVPRYRRKIVVLIVVPNVEGNFIEGAVVAVRFLRRRDQVMLLDPACAQRMQPHRKEERRREIHKSLRPEEDVNRRVERDLNRKVQHNPSVEHADFLQAGGPRHLKNGKQQQPKSLPDGRIPDQPGLPITGQVRIQVVDSLEGMVLHVISLEGNRARQKVRQIGRDGGQRVQIRFREDQVVRALMNQRPQSMARAGPNGKRRQQDYPPW